ncbi:serine/threonine protein kinase [Massilia eurypsychrophila]|jgi:formylglycine-generating enzyme required for sulfatase activity|uniref:Serine/threonine protein kinase n=1 Tax=Massilia eurypsychrophila TaxID=1485217 RepID=A0A2G8T8U6_9BURK|nr:bifunctional serine/threonine-protein kinase/formylglycine-generating enzyme family protein [Massilia eurypsychrophila]PIL42477.1 serine/threonine protein kinase [Massilia eurypsychrophila]
MQTARDKIRELRALHEDGLLSQQEFDSRKNAILDAEYAPPGGINAPPPVRQGTEIGLMVGQEIGPQNRRYKLERLIAQGGMGQVWQALDLATQAELGHSACVAIKILPPQLTMSPTHAKLLIEEATQARRLAHEHIVRVYEWAQDPATASYFIIMECLEGEDLDSLLAREGPITLERAAQLLAPVAEALQYAWDKHRLVHRDIKPGNVFVTQIGEIKLLDFGIAARARSSASSIGLEAPANSGTAGYRAPEAGVHQGEPSRALDVYAVAVMIYQMVEGRMPFDGVRTAALHPSQPAALTGWQWKVLQNGFALDPAQRPGTVAELLDQLMHAKGPTPQEVAAREAAERAEEKQRQQQLDTQRKANAEAAAAAQLIRDRQRREKEKADRAAAEVAKRERKDALRLQLLERRAADAEKARLENEEQQRQALQAKAAAAYRAEQQRARAAIAARTEAELAALLPSANSPVADAEGVLRDRYRDGSGTGPDLVLIPTGRFQMGSPEHERKKAMEAGSQKPWLDRETPQHWVGIEQPIAMGRYPVTVRQWREFVEATDWQPQGQFNWAAPGFAQADDHPVVGVSWHDAQLYLRWLTTMTGQVYRLPSEAEWEYACRAGTKTAFYFGDTISTDLANYDGNYSYNGSPKGVYRQGTSRVGEFPPNPWGLYDMHGNVWEWMQDVVHDNYDGAPNTGRAWEEGGDQGRRILRGGSWLYNPRYLRSALRNGFSAALGNDIVGFRVARNLI